MAEAPLGRTILDPEVSVYEGVYNSDANYDKLKPSKVMKLEKFGGTDAPYPTGGTRVTRGFVKVKETGTYEFRPGYGGSMENVMEVAGKVVHRKGVGGEIIRNPIKLEGGKSSIQNYLLHQRREWTWVDCPIVPGTLTSLVNFKGMYPYLKNNKGQWVSR